VIGNRGGACDSRLVKRPSYINTASSDGVLSVVGIPRRSTTDLADGSAARLTFSASGTCTRTVASASMRCTPWPAPSSLPSPRNSGSFG
jgi:hypothetical protein